MSQDVQKCLRKLEIIRRQIDWEVKNERKMFISQLDKLIEAWTKQASISKRQRSELELSIKLQDILEPKEINDVLIDSLTWKMQSDARVFIQFLIETGYEDEPDFNEDAGPLARRITPINHAARGRSGFRHILIPELFQIYHRFDVNYIDESGLTHFHVACMSGCDDVVEKFLEHGHDPNYVWRETGDSPLHMALYYGNMRIVHLLLKSGADPNLANKAGSTPLHVICRESSKGLDVAVWLFEASHEKYRPVQVDVQDKVGNSPLHLALRCGGQDLFEWLLKRITKPNLADLEGWTPLHLICDREDEDRARKEDESRCFLPFHPTNEFRLVKLFLDLHGDEVRVDARDRSGNTPLHLALARQRLNAAELLLTRGADPNLPNAEGVTPLHLICQHDDTDHLVAKLFRLCDARNQLVYVDAWDDKGRTPLQWAVAKYLTRTIDLLLMRGADLTDFVFPSESQFDLSVCRWRDQESRFESRKWASMVLEIVERLHRGGYRLELNDATTYMRTFDHFGWTKFQVTLEMGALCRKWALGFFLQLIHYRLPIIPCEMILDNLEDQDIYNICVASCRKN
ncbi:ankyrin-1-like [Trichogramma pretiosum]|uniref:ankyrin-1-like n=1 Tax=Trichogramma pretiosum TaxID=7493 RepID=UPI0006C9980C|nr:ankyrin-1-like [Trichogramma pretiosum]